MKRNVTSTLKDVFDHNLPDFCLNVKRKSLKIAIESTHAVNNRKTAMGRAKGAIFMKIESIDVIYFITNSKKNCYENNNNFDNMNNIKKISL